MSRTLVLQLARFGDLVQTKRLLLTLAAEPGGDVHLCVDDSLVPLARMLYPFAEVHGLPAHKGAADPAAVLTGARETLARLRALAPDAVYVLNFSQLSFACAALFQPAQLRGYARIKGQDMRGRWASIAFNLMHDRRFAPLNLADLWACFHPAPIAPAMVNPIPRPAGTGRVGLVMAGRESRRSLPPKVLAACVQAVFQARGGPELVCIGSAAESALVRRLARELPAACAGRITDYTGKTGLTDLPELIRSLDLVITPDTGAMHLAAHLGIPVQAFFLSSAWCWETGPYGFGHTVWQALESCSPCVESAPCPHDHVCLQPFSSPSLLAHLSGKRPASWPDSLLGCVSMLDDLGVTYNVVDGDDPYSDARQELRNGIVEYLVLGREKRPPFMRPDLAEFLYREKDWMLPGNWERA